MDKFSWLAAEVKAYGLYGAQVRAWAATRRCAHSGMSFRSTAQYGRGRGWPDSGYAYVRGRSETAAFFRAFAGAVEDACRGRGVADVVSDYGDRLPETAVHDDRWTPSPLHNPHPAAGLMAELAARDGLQLVGLRSWCRTIPSGAGETRTRYAKNAVLCVLEMQQAELLAESLRRFAEMKV